MDFHELLDILDSPLLGLQPLEQQLSIAGDTIFRAGQLYAEHSWLFFDSIDAQVAIDGPPMPLNCFDKFVRQSMHVDLEQFVQPTTFLRSPNQPHDPSSVDLTFDLDAVLDLLPSDEVAISHDDLLDLAGDDYPSLWIQLVQDWLADCPGTSVSLLDLKDGVGLSLSQVWIALLLADFGGRLSQSTDDFYSTSGISLSLLDV